MNRMPAKAKALVVVVILGCAAITTYAAMQGLPSADLRFAVVLGMAAIAGRLKVKLPGFDSNMSMNLPFILTALVQLSLPHAIVVGVVSTFVQCLPSRGQETKLVQAAFNVCTIANAIGLSFLIATYASKAMFLPEKPALIVLGAAGFFLADSIPIAAIVSSVGGGKMWKVWSEMALLTFPHFVLSAGVASIIVATSRYMGVAWSLALPVMFVVFLSFRVYMRNAGGRMREPKQAFSAAAD